MNVLEHFPCSADYSEIFVKDLVLESFQKRFPQFAGLAKKMRSHLPDGYENYLVDLSVQNCEFGDKTCRDVRWHLDGEVTRDNQYVLWVRGPNRTRFLEKPIELPEMPEERLEQNSFLENLLRDSLSIEAPEEHIIGYDSKTPHKGVICKNFGKRVFVRMMATNYIQPKNHTRKSVHEIR